MYTSLILISASFPTQGRTFQLLSEVAAGAVVGVASHPASCTLPTLLGSYPKLLTLPIPEVYTMRKSVASLASTKQRLQSLLRTRPLQRALSTPKSLHMSPSDLSRPKLQALRLNPHTYGAGVACSVPLSACVRARDPSAVRRADTRMSISAAVAAPALLLTASTAMAMRHTRLLRALSPPLAAFLACAVLANVGAIPAACAAYDAAAACALPLAVATSLLAPLPQHDAEKANKTEKAENGASDIANERSTAAAGEVLPQRGGGAARQPNELLAPTLAAFAIGAVGSVVGAMCAFQLSVRLTLWSRAEAACAAACLAATYVGGSANFFGVAAAIGAQAHASLLPSLVAADLVTMGVYLVALFAIARAADETADGGDEAHGLGGGGGGGGDSGGGDGEVVVVGAAAADAGVGVGGGSSHPAALSGAHPPRLLRLVPSGAALLMAVTVCAAGSALEKLVEAPGVGMVVITALSSVGGRVLARSSAARAATLWLEPFSQWLSCLFLGSLGAEAQLRQLASAGPVAALACAVALGAHALTLAAGCRLCGALGVRIPLRCAIIGSNANVGGSGTAVAMASALGWRRLAAPAVACGTLGYAVATAIGVAIHAALR